jgi:hypothetical protein
MADDWVCSGASCYAAWCRHGESKFPSERLVEFDEAAWREAPFAVCGALPRLPPRLRV